MDGKSVKKLHTEHHADYVHISSERLGAVAVYDTRYAAHNILKFYKNFMWTDRANLMQTLLSQILEERFQIFRHHIHDVPRVALLGQTRRFAPTRGYLRCTPCGVLLTFADFLSYHNIPRYTEHEI